MYWCGKAKAWRGGKVNGSHRHDGILPVTLNIDEIGVFPEAQLMNGLDKWCCRQWQRSVRKSFFFWQRLGVHVVPNHFYNPVPDTREFTNNFWSRQSELVGIDMRDDAQINLLRQFALSYASEYERFPQQKTEIAHEYYVNNRTYEQVDGEVLYCMIRHFKPRRMIEIGSGFSTFLSAKAMLVNEQETGQKCDFTAIEPYPGKVLESGFPGLTRLLKKPVQDVDLSEFSALGQNDILFIDSSHVLKAGSDVQYEFLEILPRLNKGVIVHVHDIFLPLEYPKEWMHKHLRFWNGTVSLESFLAFNRSFACFCRQLYEAQASERAARRLLIIFRPGQPRLLFLPACQLTHDRCQGICAGGRECSLLHRRIK